MKYYQVYVKTDCGFCKKTIDLMKSRADKFVLVALDMAPDEVVASIKRNFNHDTFPIILQVEGDKIRMVGGYAEITQLFNDEVQEVTFNEMTPEEQNAILGGVQSEMQPV